MAHSDFVTIAVDRPFMKGLLNKHRLFLRACFDAKIPKQAAKLISGCSLYQAHVLLRIFHLEVNHEIILRVVQAKKLKAKKKFDLLIKYFEDSGEFESLMQHTIQYKKAILLKFSTVLSVLMEPLFTS